jgi:general bacterial porin, GBP family
MRHRIQPVAPSLRFSTALARLTLCAAGALDALGAAPAAQAATLFEKDNARIDLYGILDVGLGYLRHSYDASDVLASTVNSYNLNGSPHSFTGLYTGGASMSRLGLRGEAGFGTGQKAFFRLETAVNVTSGVLANNGQAIYDNIYRLHTANSASAINGQALSRGAFAGVSDPTWGSLELGRTLNFALEQTAEYDPLRAALLYSPLGYSGGIGGGLGATENSRLDESLRYENRLGPMEFGAQYKLAGDKRAQSAGYGWVAMLGYRYGGFSIRGTGSEMTNTVTWPVQYSNVVPADPNVQVENTKGYMLTVRYERGPAAVEAGYESLTVWAPSNTHLVVQDYYGLIPPKPSVNASGQQYLSLYWLGGNYKLAPQLELDAGFYDIDTYNTPEVGKDYWATAYSLLVDYIFSRSFDTYIGVMVMQYSGPGLTKHHPFDAFSSNGMYGIGVRYRF